jgi:ATP-dependent Lon protease
MSRIWFGYLRRPRFTPESAERTAVPGVATGLAVTGLGGGALYTDASSTAGEPGLQLTGQLGDVMKESAEIALFYVRSHAQQLGFDPAALDRKVHVHVRAGAAHKDGRSAGVDGGRAGVDGHRPAGLVGCLPVMAASGRSARSRAR